MLTTEVRQYHKNIQMDDLPAELLAIEESN